MDRDWEMINREETNQEPVSLGRMLYWYLSGLHFLLFSWQTILVFGRKYYVRTEINDKQIQYYRNTLWSLIIILTKANKTLKVWIIIKIHPSIVKVSNKSKTTFIDFLCFPGSHSWPVSIDCTEESGSPCSGGSGGGVQHQSVSTENVTTAPVD